MQYKGTNWNDVISRHNNALRDDNRAIDRAMEMYNGRYWSETERLADVTCTSFNLVFAITESAVSMLVPTNIRFSVNTVKGQETWIPDKLEDALENYSDLGDWRNEAVISVTDAVLTGRAILKVIPDDDPNAMCPVSLRAVRPQQVLFDLSARRPDDIGWFAETQMVDWPTFDRRLKDRVYRIPASARDSTSPYEWFKARAQAWPEALGSKASTASESNTWLRLYEVWDKNARCMSVWCEGCEEPLTHTLFAPKKWAFPYVIFNLNYNGRDCLGLSEVQLCLDNIEAINRMLSWMMTVVRRQVPVTAYNANLLGESDIARIACAQPGDYVAVRPEGLASLDGLFMSTPVPGISGDMTALMAKLEQVVSYTSALADAARGQVTGARTATELALIESQQRTRNGARETRFRQAWARAGALVVWHMQKRSRPLSEVIRTVKLVAYNASESNRAVLRENFDKLYAYMTDRCAAAKAAGEPLPFDQSEIDKLFVSINGLPDGVREEEEEGEMSEGAEEGGEAEAEAPETEAPEAEAPEMEMPELMESPAPPPGPGVSLGPTGLPEGLPPLDMQQQPSY